MKHLLPKLAIFAMIAIAFLDGILIANKFLNDDKPVETEEVAVMEDILELFPKTTEQPEPTQEPVLEPEVEPAQEITSYDVPFTSQAPYGTWGSPWYKYAEEACVYMAMNWVTGSDMPEFRQVAIDLYEIGSWEIEQFGTSDVTSAIQNRDIFMNYYGHSAAYLTDNTDVESLQDALHSGHIVMLNVNGQTLDNPNYGGQGPENHAILLIGYDEDRGVFIANDPGTRYGEAVEYTYEKILAASQDLAILIKR